jgi:hypothetical protein
MAKLEAKFIMNQKDKTDTRLILPQVIPCWYWYTRLVWPQVIPARYTPCYRCYNRARAWIADQQWLEALIIISMADGFTQKKACAKKMLF